MMPEAEVVEEPRPPEAVGRVTVESGPGTDVAGRLLGHIEGAERGPTLLCIAGIHGNEPAGVHAVRRVLAGLHDRHGEMSGRFIAFAGNLAALEVGCRFVDRDLNRAWTSSRLAALRDNQNAPESVEDREQVELLAAIEEVLSSADGPVYALDLHTTSGPGGVFSAFTDSLPHRDFAASFPVPMIFGLEELVDGTLLNLLSEHGIVALTVETGQHDEPEAVDRAEAAIWIAAVRAGLLPERLAPEAITARERLERDSHGVPRALEMRHRHHVVEDDEFVMVPGYHNFQSVSEGDVVAHDARGDILLDESGRLLMPLYQAQGEDGFFLVREFRPFWMNVSLIMRRAGLSRIAHWLPGVRRIPGTEDQVLVDKRVARFFARQLFHLLGYRQLEDAGHELVMRRRRFDERKYLRHPPEPGGLDDV
jgi:succinylglutamate desuccinylase/aspartoacylase family protein